MRITNTCVSIWLTASGILSFAGCSLWGPESKGEAQFDSTAGSPSKSLAGMYSDLGSNGSIKPHPESTYKMNQESQGRSSGVVILGGPADMPDMRTGDTTIKGTTGGTTSRPEFRSKSKGGGPGQ